MHIIYIYIYIYIYIERERERERERGMNSFFIFACRNIQNLLKLD